MLVTCIKKKYNKQNHNSQQNGIKKVLFFLCGPVPNNQCPGGWGTAALISQDVKNFTNILQMVWMGLKYNEMFKDF